MARDQTRPVDQLEEHHTVYVLGGICIFNQSASAFWPLPTQSTVVQQLTREPRHLFYRAYAVDPDGGEDQIEVRKLQTHLDDPGGLIVE